MNCRERCQNGKRCADEVRMVCTHRMKACPNCCAACACSARHAQWTWKTDARGVLVYSRGAACAGYDDAVAVGMNAEAFLLEFDHLPHYDEQKPHARVWFGTVRVRCADGAALLMNNVREAVFDAAGALAGYRGISSPLHERDLFFD